MNVEALQEHIGRTLWSPGGAKLLEIIDRTHILNVLWEKWANDPSSRAPYTTAMPGPAQATRNAEDRSGKPMTRQINFVPYTIQSVGPVAIMVADQMSLDIYERWRQAVDTLPDYIGSMITRGRYVGRQTMRMGIR